MSINSPYEDFEVIVENEETDEFECSEFESYNAAFDFAKDVRDKTNHSAFVIKRTVINRFIKE